ncbi:Uncharacterized protein APZ42_010302 [Daphnia magna]|uniref:Uncharacterized protein n=1 Tax=Daphnia magna TaxID=35525 RepID=A0A164DGI3_9CRUS|nr:Uncharacterized protein APZ42_010302 [Daphnia magna]
MKLYEKDDKFISQAALKSILNHFWYLCEETVIFAVFHKKLSPFTRKSMIDKLLTFPRPESIPVGKPKFPADLVNKSNVSDSLLSCIGPRSWLLFFLLKKDEELTDWIKDLLNAGNMWLDTRRSKVSLRLSKSLMIAQSAA